MTKSPDEEWREYKIKKISKSKGYNKSDFPEDLNVFYQKNLTLDEGLLKMIWMIRKQNSKLRSEKQVVREALSHYLSTLREK